jgi:hypothetical protein
MDLGISRLIADHPILLAVITLLVFLGWTLPQWLGGVWPLFSNAVRRVCS